MGILLAGYGNGGWALCSTGLAATGVMLPAVSDTPPGPIAPGPGPGPGPGPAPCGSRTVLLIGLWVDDHPEGGLPPRLAGLEGVVDEAGLTLAMVHRRELDAAPWLAAPPAGMMLSGSRLNLGEDCELADFPAVTTLLERLPQVPVLGVCFGHQLLACHAGGRLERLEGHRQEADWPVRHGQAHGVFAGLPDPCPLAENHGRRVAHPGPDYRIIATSEDGIEAMAHRQLPRLGTQFHPEYFPTQAVPYGRRFLANWLRGLGAG